MSRRAPHILHRDDARVVIVGTSGAGKTTLAREVARAMRAPHIELDALHWGPGWTPRPTFREDVTAATARERWVLDGNYSSARDIVWPRATTIVWLDYSRARVTWRIVTRTLRRTVTRQELWNGNRETLSKALSRDSIIWWSWSTWARRRRDYPALFGRPEYAPLRLLRLTHPREAEAMLDALRLRRGRDSSMRHQPRADASEEVET